MKILVVSDYAWPTGGIEQFVYEFLRRAQDRGFECRFLTWTEEPPVPVDFNGRVVIQCGDIGQAWRAMDEADVVLVATSFNLRLLARLVVDYVWVGETPVVSVVQTSGHSDRTSPSAATQERWLMALVCGSSATVAVSAEVGATLKKLAPGVVVHLIENASRLHATSIVPRGRKRISFIGRPSPQKGFDLFERLATELRDSNLEFSVNTVSIEPPRRIQGVSYSVRLGDAELKHFFERTDLLVVPYLLADGLPLAILEALNCGVPAVGFNSPGVGALLRRHGQLVVESKYSALLSAVKDWQAGRLEVQPPIAGSVASWDEQIDRYLKLLMQVASR